MQEKKIILTYEGRKEYEEELRRLKEEERQRVAQSIKKAMELGDITENSEYDAAKDEQRDIETRIEKLEEILRNAEIIVEEEVDLNYVNVGCTVRILDIEEGEEIECKVVGSVEADSLNGKISNESPVGKALIGSAVGDTVKVETPMGALEFKVLDIRKSN